MHTAHFQAIARASENGKVTIGCRTAGPIIDLLERETTLSRTSSALGDGADRNRVIVGTAARKLKAGKFGLLFCLKSNPRLVTAAWLADIPQRFAYMQAFDPRGIFLTRRIVVPKVTAHPLHMSKADLLLDALGVPYDHATARLHPKTDALAQARRADVRGDGPLIAIGVNASVPQRQWGDRFIPLVKHLHDLTGARFVLFGGPDVKDVAGTSLPAPNCRQHISST